VVRWLNSAKDGRRCLQAATAYLCDQVFRASKPEVLIWKVFKRFFLTKLGEGPKWLEKAGMRSLIACLCKLHDFI